MSSAAGKIFDAGILKRVLRQVRPYRGPFIITGILVLILAALAPVRPWLIRIGLDDYLPAQKQLPSWLTETSFDERFPGLTFEQHGDANALLNVFLLVVAFLLFEAVLQFFQTYLANAVAQSVTLDLRSTLYNHVLKFRLKYFDNTPVGTFVTRLVSDIDGIAQVFSNGILTIIGDLLRLVVVIVVMFVINWKLAAVVILPIPILLLATRVFQRVIKKAFIDVRNKVAQMNVFVQEHVTGMSIVQIFNREKREQEKFREINKQHMKAHLRTVWAFSIFFPVVELLSASSVALLLWWGIGDAVSGEVTLGIIMQFILYVFMLYRPIRQLADRFTVLQEGIVNAERVFKIFDKEEVIPAGSGDYSFKFEDKVKFEDVWFAYQHEDWVLKDMSFEVKAGETVAFVGATGAGKTSVINLLSRFYEFQKGSIRIDGRNIRSFHIDDLRKNIAVVLQDVFLFSDSIYNNITLLDPSITREEVIAAAKAVGAHEFISKLPGQYDYDVKERGGMLSVGQRQLLAFIRAYVYNPSILILDEATSSVDTESEELIQNAINKLTEGRTSIIIAHRLSTIQNADKIVVLDKGRLMEMGTHDELLEKDGQYRKLFELQFQND